MAKNFRDSIRSSYKHPCSRFAAPKLHICWNETSFLQVPRRWHKLEPARWEPAFRDFTSILINPRNGDEIFVGNAYQTGEIGGGVYRTTNAGSTWTRIDPKERRLPSQRIWALAFDSRDQNTLFVGSHSAGVYVVPRGSDTISAATP